MRREYVESGGLTWLTHVRGAGPALLLLHRPPFCGSSLRPLAEHAARRFLVVAPDLPGYGGTDALAEDPPRIEDYAAACVELAGDLGLERFAVAGEGESAFVALAIARAIPSRVTGVAAIAPPAQPAEPPGADAGACLPDAEPCWDGRHLAALWAWLRESSCFSPWHARRLEHRILAPMPAPQVLQSRLVQLLGAPAQGRHYARLLRAARDRAGRLPASVERIGVPVLVAGGRDHRDEAALEGLSPSQALLCDTRDEAARRVVDRLPVAPACEPRWPRRPKPGQLSPAFVKVAGGELRCVMNADAATVPLVVQHDAASSIGTVEPIVRSFIGRRTVVAFDLPGSGLSTDTLPPDPVPIEVYAERVAEGLDRLGLGQVDFYGMWGGGFVGLELARLFPGRVRRLVVSNLFCHEGEERRWFQENYTPDVSPLWHGGHLLQAWHQMRDQGLFYPWFDRSEAGILRREPFIDTWMVHERVCSLLQAGNRYRSAYQAHFVYPTLERLAEVRVPTLVATTSWDPNRPHTEHAAALNPHCGFLMLDPDFRRWGESFAEFLERP